MVGSMRGWSWPTLIHLVLVVVAPVHTRAFSQSGKYEWGSAVLLRREESENNKSQTVGSNVKDSFDAILSDLENSTKTTSLGNGSKVIDAERGANNSADHFLDQPTSITNTEGAAAGHFASLGEAHRGNEEKH